uniref:EGF-like domain-containing protein n=1 Tax=Parastrongyloides trichosuri TaxID=131310 RepID=A0A0N4Z0I8_PARTI
MTKLLLTISLFFIVTFIQSTILPIKNEPPYPVSRGTPLVKNNNLICVNGHKSGLKCICKPGFSGEFCQNKMYCINYNRTNEGECDGCLDHYEGSYCDVPICKHGKASEKDQKCICDEPYSGEFCDKFNKADVLLFHNQKMRMFGPIGFLAIIPMALIYYCCEKDSKKRKIRRYAKILEGEEFEVCHKAVKKILEDK